LSQRSNPGLKLANAFGVISNLTQHHKMPYFDNLGIDPYDAYRF
jgi:hypothetical protein